MKQQRSEQSRFGLGLPAALLSCFLVAGCGKPPDIKTFSAVPDTINEFESATLEWSVSRASYCRISPGVGEVSGKTGSVSVEPTTGTTYTMECENRNGRAERETEVTVISVSVEIVSVTTEPRCISPGETIDISWQVRNADSCTLSGGFGEVDVPNGTVSTTADVSETLELTCKGIGGPVSEKVPIRVNRSGAWTVTGTALYERPPITLEGLDYANLATHPIRNAAIELRDDCTDTLIETRILPDDGVVTFNWDGSSITRYRIHAKTDSPEIQVVDNTAQGALYVLDSWFNDAWSDSVTTTTAGSGWTGSGYTGSRSAAPFALLDSAYHGATQVAALGPETLPPLTINWSQLNSPEGDGSDEDIAAGRITTSYWDGQELYILGLQDVDTDEYDQHVVVHEWGHYFETTLSRADSLGGPHTLGDILDMRVAFSEGLCNALSGILLHPDNIYKDTLGTGQSTTPVAIDLDDNSSNYDPEPGWFSEASVQAIIYDLFDDDDSGESWDSISAGLAPIYRAMVTEVAETSLMTSIYVFLDGLQNHGVLDTAIQALATKHSIDGLAGPDGDNESNDGGWPANLPIYTTLARGGNKSFQFDGSAPYNWATQNRFALFTGDGSNVTISTDSDTDVDILLYRDGTLLQTRESISGDETISGYPTTDGQVYVINVIGFGQEETIYNATLSLD